MAGEPREYNKVLEYIKQLLLAGELSSGDKLPTERLISETLSIGRNSTREALRSLENLGMIESRQGSGNYLVGDITKPIADALTMMLILKKTNQREISQVRRYMDLLAFTIAFDHPESLDLTELLRILSEMEGACVEERIHFDKAFHYMILSASENQLLIGIMSALSQIYETSVRFVLTTADETVRNRFVQAHRDICLGLMNRDKELGVRAIHEHYDLIEKELLAGGQEPRQ